MRILVTHDRPEAAARIQETLGRLGLDDLRLDIEEDGVSTRERLRTTAYDVAIIDLTIPNIKGRGAPDYTVAEMLLQEAMEDANLLAPGDIIGVTREKEALGRVGVMTGVNLMAVVEESDGSDWLQEIADRVLYCGRHVAARQRSLFSRHDFDVAVITALDEEFAPYRSIFELEPHPRADGVYTFVFRDRSDHLRRGVARSIGRAGQAAAASATQAMVTQFRPKVALMTGFCGGVASKAQLGEVLIAESVFDWDYGKWKMTAGQPKFHARPEPIVIRGEPIHSAARQLAASYGSLTRDACNAVLAASNNAFNGSKVRPAAFASGSAVIGTDAILDRIAELSDSIAAIDMEAFGFHFAARNTPVVRPAALCIKAVADFCDASKGDEHHPACSLASALVAESFMRRGWTF